MGAPQTDVKKVILISGASSGFGRLSAEALAAAGHTVYASMRDTTGRNADKVADMARFAAEHGVDLRTIELDVGVEASVEAAVGQIIATHGRLDVVMHNAGHMVSGPSEAFTPGPVTERAAAYDAGAYAGYADKISAAFDAIVPADADPGAVAREVVRIVGLPHGQRPFRSVVDPSHDGADVGFAVTDRLRAEMLHRTGLSELLTPAV